MASNDGSKTNSVDIDKLRVSERQLDNSMRDAASTVASTTKDKDGQERFWGFKVSKTAAFAINSLYDNVVLPFTREGSKQIYNGVYQIAQRSGASLEHAHGWAATAALVGKGALIAAKVGAETFSINKEYLTDRSELHEKITNAIAGTPADFSQNEIIQTAYDKIHGNWSRDMVRKLPDIAKTAIQVGMAYSEHQADMAKKPAAMRIANEAAKTAPETTPGTPAAPRVDTEKEALRQRIKDLQAEGADPEFIKMEVEDFKRNRGDIDPKDEVKQLGIFTPNLSGTLGFSTELLKVGVDEYTAGKSNTHKETAWDNIQLLKTFMDEQPAGQDPKRMRINGMSLDKFLIEKVFQQNEVDRGRGRMGEALIEQLKPSVDKIAAQLANTMLDTGALVYLVGEHKIIKHEGAARIFVSQENVEETLDSLHGIKSKEHVNKDEFFSNYSDPVVAREVVKKTALSLEGTAKAVFVAAFPDEIIAEAGFSKEAILALRKEAHDSIFDVTVLKTLELAKDSPEKLKEFGLNKAEIAAVQQLAQDIMRGNEGAIETAVFGADRTVISAIRTAALHEQVATNDTTGKVWTETVERAASLHDKIHSGALAQEAKAKSFAERERKAEHAGPHAAAHHPKTDPNMTAAEREAHRRKSHGQEPHEGIGAR